MNPQMRHVNNLHQEIDELLDLNPYSRLICHRTAQGINAMPQGSAFVGSILSNGDRSAAVHLVQRQARRVLTSEKRIDLVRACEDHSGAIIRRADDKSAVAVAIFHRDAYQAFDDQNNNNILLSDLAVESRYSRCGVGRFAFDAAVCLGVVTCDGPVGRIAVGSIAKGVECASFLQHVGVTLIDEAFASGAPEPWIRQVDLKLRAEKSRDHWLNSGHNIGLVNPASVPEMAERVVVAEHDGLVNRNNGFRFLFVDPSAGRAAIMSRLIGLARRDASLLKHLGIPSNERPRLVVANGREALDGYVDPKIKSPL